MHPLRPQQKMKLSRQDQNQPTKWNVMFQQKKEA